ncbi:PREDICTED: glutelin-2-like [Camelina sativa]|uniref:Glutelin-2-like n=1 Tax=Camelina sativa TaxID=90675 RepID=A0ABM0WWU8_CAMSA|nr:PREDICTED: glutelin-2-like [Camelina sativa]
MECFVVTLALAVLLVTQGSHFSFCLASSASSTDSVSNWFHWPWKKPPFIWHPKVPSWPPPQPPIETHPPPEQYPPPTTYPPPMQYPPPIETHPPPEPPTTYPPPVPYPPPIKTYPPPPSHYPP